MNEPKKTLTEYKVAIKKVKIKLKTVDLTWRDLQKAEKRDFVNVELYKDDELSYYDCLLDEAYSSTSRFYPDVKLVKALRKLFAY